MATPTIRVTDKTAEKRGDREDQKAPSELQRLNNEVRRLSREIQTMKANAIKDAGSLKQLVRGLPKHAIRDRVTGLVREPHKYDRSIPPASFYSYNRHVITFYEAFEDEEYQQPALVQLSWQNAGRCSNLNDTEVEVLREAGFDIHQDLENSYDVETPFYLYWRERAATTMWLSMLDVDEAGPSWCYCMASKIRTVRNQDKAKWKKLVSLNNLPLLPWPNMILTTEALIRESQYCVLFHPVLLQTIPAELRLDTDLQVSLFKIAQEAMKFVKSSEEAEIALLLERKHLDEADVGKLTVVKKQ